MNRLPQAAVVEAEQDKTVTDEGTAIHWVAECLKRASAAVVTGEGVPYVGCVAPNGVLITDELFDAAEFYVDALESPMVPNWHIERQLAAPSIHAQCGGTPDAYGMSVFGALNLWDLKGGFRLVDVHPNYQLYGYVAAILDNHPEWNRPDQVVELCIVQPRAFHPDGPIRTFRTTVAECAPYIARLRVAAQHAMGDNAPATASPEQCANCAARGSCKAAQIAAAWALEVSTEAEMFDLTPDAVDWELLRLEQAAQIIEARRTGLEAQARHMLRNGKHLSNWSMVAGRGRLGWKDEQAERAAIAMGDLLGVQLRKPTKAITPTQASKLLDASLITDYTVRPRGEMKLARHDGSMAAKAFSKLNVEK
jgi:hypothetical protein